LRARLIRLHPLVLLAVALGALGYWLDPFVGASQQVGGLRMAPNAWLRCAAATYAP
jgi:hypothetical protein